MLHVYGDSWAKGAELTNSENPFAYHLSTMLKTTYINHGVEGASLGYILHNLISTVDKIEKNDMVVVIIPPDIRWYRITKEFLCCTLFLDDVEYKNSLNYLTIEWFIYHHNLFMCNIISLLKEKTNNFVLVHNYGKLIITDMFTNKIDKKYFLNDSSLTALLGGKEWDQNYSNSKSEDGPCLTLFQGKYFEGKKSHPNDLGHRKIAELIYEYFTK